MPDTTPTDRVLEVLRTTPENRHVLRGFGPLAALVVLVVAMMLLAPSVAPEHIVESRGETTTEPVGTRP